MECHVYFDAWRNQIAAFKDSPSWVGPTFVFVGVFTFDKMNEPDHTYILNWTLPRLKLLDISHNKTATVINRASQAYWGEPPYE